MFWKLCRKVKSFTFSGCNLDRLAEIKFPVVLKVRSDEAFVAGMAKIFLDNIANFGNTRSCKRLS